MANLVTCAFAFKEGFNTSLQLNKSAGHDTTIMYLKNIFVSLVSAMKHNPDDEFMLCVNEDIPKEWEDKFTGAHIKVRKIEFDSFVLSRQFTWALGYYKLCVMKKLADEGTYDRILLLDADTFTTGSYGDLWKECDFGVLLFPVGHSFSHPDRDTIRKDFVSLYPEESKKLAIVHYGGEFIAGNISDLKKYTTLCKQVFDRLSNAGEVIAKNAGDESVWSMAAALSDGFEVITASPYIFRFWTEDFYLVSTVTVSNPVCVWHMPQEKPTGILRIYDYYMAHGQFPDVKKASKFLGLGSYKRPFDYITISNKIRRKLKKF